MSRPIELGYYLYRQKIYKVVKISRGTDEVQLEDTHTGQLYVVRYSLFDYAYKRVYRIKDVSNFLERHPNSIYRYEKRNQIRKPVMYPDKRDRLIRYYQMEDVLDMHELLSMIHGGRPRKDHKIVNNTLPDIASLKKLLKEKYK